jgi:hypothetical protein
MAKNKSIEKALKDIQSSYREAITQLLITVGQNFINSNQDVKTIGFGSAYEYNDNDYDHNYRISADEIEINGMNMWELEDVEEDVDDDDRWPSFVKKQSKIEHRDKFGELAQELEEVFAPFDGNLHQVFGNNFKIVISKTGLKVENDAYDY